MQETSVYKSSYSIGQVIINLSRRFCFDTNSKMLLQCKIILLSLIFNLVHSNIEDFDMDSTTSDESCNKPDDIGSESDCYCYSQPEIDFEYSICAITNDKTNNCTHDDLKYPGPEYRLANAKCFYLEKIYMNFEDARENCKQNGGKLYEPKTVVEFRDAPNMKFPGFNNNYMWIGITDTESEGSYVYDSNGKSITFNPPWYIDLSRGHKFPHGTGSNCIALNNAFNAYTFDLPCVDTYASLCEL